MFRSIAKPPTATVRLTVNGRACTAPAGSSVWTAMALAGETTTRTAPVSEQPRSAYCAMGVCFECLVEIDGLPNRQACLTEVQEGMVVQRQNITERSEAPRPAVPQPDFELAREVSGHA